MIEDARQLYIDWDSLRPDFAESVAHLSHNFRNIVNMPDMSDYFIDNLSSLGLLDRSRPSADYVTRKGWLAINMFHAITYPSQSDIDVELSEPLTGVDILPYLAMKENLI